ncbi:arginine--tRNA ligase [Halobacteriales archaeon SW_6_65_46]|nr:MAG: arginine--tRNA ligase [Halobacteriales archaeon SW_6_65_46]
MFIAFREEVTTALADALADCGYPSDDLGIEQPPEGFDAVLASSVSFGLASEAERPPPQVAGAVREDAGELPATGDSVVVEHTSANPTGPVHVGRARNPIIGDAVANLLEYAGNDVERHYYVNDAGRQMALFTWAYERFDETELPDPERDRTEYEMVRYYRKGSEFLDSADERAVETAEAEIESILQGLDAGDEATYERVGAVVDAVLGGMKTCLARLPATFDEFVKETRFMKNGDTDEVIDRLKQLDQAVYEEDAWQLDLDGFEKNLVFLRSDDTSLYTTRDLAHHEWKFEEYDRAVTVLGEDHTLQAGQLRETLELLGNDTDQLASVIYSYVDLPDGGMSTRAGTGVDLDDLLDEAIVRARDEVESRLDDRDRDDELDEADIERIARQVGIGAVRYDIVSKQPTKAITFEWDRALDFEAQSAPYVQYVHARCCGILNGVDAVPAGDVSALTEPESRELLREIARFEGVIDAAATELRPHQVATYTRDLAEAFNAFYRECPVLSVEGELRDARLALVAAARHTMANALDVLGVEAPVSM